MESERGNTTSTRNQRLAALHVFYEFLGRTVPEVLHSCAKIAAIATKRYARPEMKFLAREEVEALFASIRPGSRLSTRDHAMLLLFYNTGARVSEVAGLTVGQLSLNAPRQVRLLGKGSKWRTCPLWDQTAKALRTMLDERTDPIDLTSPVFIGPGAAPMTRFGMYKRIRHYGRALEMQTNSSSQLRITPHTLRHTTAVHLLEAGVEVNVIRGWLGHVSLETTNRYAEITVRMKADALKLCDPVVLPATRRLTSTLQNDTEMLAWLSSL